MAPKVIELKVIRSRSNLMQVYNKSENIHLNAVYNKSLLENEQNIISEETKSDWG